MERMGSLDAVSLAAEDAVNHMHIGSVAIFEGPVPSYETVRALVASKLQFVPRYRRRVREAPASVGRPLWVDDVEFDLDLHLRHTALPSGDRFGLENLVSRVMSHPLDRRQPLWEMWLIEGVADDRWALLSKVHQCMIDAAGHGDLLAVMIDAVPDAPPLVPDAWSPAPAPTRVELARATGEMTIESIAVAVRGGLPVLQRPGVSVGRVRELASGVARVVTRGRRADSSLTGPIGPRRRWARTHATLDDVNAIRGAFGGSVTDVVVAATARGLRSLLLARGEEVDYNAITTLVPISIRGADGRGPLAGSPVFARLPIGIEDPVELIAAVRDHLPELDESRAPGYVCGRPLREAYPYAPVATNARIAIALWSYCGTISFGVTGDWQGAPDTDRLAREIDIAFEDLLKQAAGALA